jgi:hypothetical protein
LSMRFAQAIRTVPPIKCEAGFRRKRSSCAQLPPGSSAPSGQMRKALLVVADRPRHWLGRSAVVTHGSVRGIVGALGRRAFRSFAGMIPRGHNNNRMMYGSAIPGRCTDRQRGYHQRRQGNYTNVSIAGGYRRHLGLFVGVGFVVRWLRWPGILFRTVARWHRRGPASSIAAVVTNGRARAIVGASRRRRFPNLASMIARDHTDDRMMYGNRNAAGSRCADCQRG